MRSKASCKRKRRRAHEYSLTKTWLSTRSNSTIRVTLGGLQVVRAARVARQHPVIQQRHRVDALRRVLGKCRERTMPDIIIMCVRACVQPLQSLRITCAVFGYFCVGNEVVLVTSSIPG